MNHQDEIAKLKNKLDTYNSNSAYHLTPELQRLRNYIFQVHNFYEVSMEELIANSSQIKALLDTMTFADKLVEVERIKRHFPVGAAKKIGSLRNIFAHKNGEGLGERYGTEREIFKKLHSLSLYMDEIHIFWMVDGGLSESEAREQATLNNKRF